MLTFSKVDQDHILATAAEATHSIGWAKDAVGYIALDKSQEEPREIAVMVFQRFEGRTAEMHFALLNGRMRRDLMQMIRWLAFHDRGAALDKVWAIIPAWNRAAQVAALREGFEFEYRKRSGIVGGGDAIVLSMGNPARAPARLQTTEE